MNSGHHNHHYRVQFRQNHQHPTIIATLTITSTIVATTALPPRNFIHYFHHLTRRLHLHHQHTFATIAIAIAVTVMVITDAATYIAATTATT